ncbi:MAG TPA: SMP-30/gluconolactonase/LRE family protein [Solirubrobacterales bacterium]|nr:SMP-30/gluconolactonase/LRE family protein [Solirubrobacterales bacterium]
MNRTRIAASDCDCVQRVAATCGESPMWSVREQALYWTDNLGGRIHRLEPESGREQCFVLRQNVMAIGLRKGAGLVLALAKQFAFYEPGGELELIMSVEQDQPHNRINDAKVDRSGRCWAGTMNEIDWDKPSGSLYRLDPGLELTRLQGAVVCGNGLGWSPDNRTFYFCESFRHAIFAYDFDPDAGVLSARRVFATVDQSSGGFPDGLTVDAEGGVWSAQCGAGRVARYAPNGEVTHEVEVPLPQPTSCIFGGRDLGVLYITTSRQNLTPEQLGRYPLSGSVFAVRPGLSGVPEPHFAQ